MCVCRERERERERERGRYIYGERDIYTEIEIKADESSDETVYSIKKLLTKIHFIVDR